jgi:AbrB family looped-hinge helix DNA binding protein
MTVKMSTKGWIVIPAALRKKYGLKPGSDLQVVDYGGVLSIIPISGDPIKTGAGMLKDTDSLTEAIIEEHRQERESES